MSEVTHRHITTFRWICTNKRRCDELDAEIKEITDHAAHLSGYVANGYVKGLECLTLDTRFKAVIKDLRAERASLWRRVKQEIDEETISEDVPAVEHIPAELYQELVEKHTEAA